MSLGGSQTTTTTTEQPAWLQNAMQGNINRANSIANQPYQTFGGPRIADFTDDQQAAMAATRGAMGQSTASFDEARDFLRESAKGVNPERIQASTMQAPQLAQAMGYNPAQSQAFDASATRGADAMGAYDNPYQRQVIDRAMGDLDRAEDRQLSQARRRAAGANSFGGSRTAILESEIMRGFNDQRGDIAADLRARGFDTALQAGQADANRMTNTNQFNAGQRTQVGEANAGRSDAAARYSADMGNNFALTQAGMDMDANRANMDAINSTRGFNATNAMEADLAQRNMQAGAASGLGQIEGLDRNATNQDIDRLMNVGSMEQRLRQGGLDLAVDDFNRQRDWNLRGLNALIQATGNVPAGMFGSTSQKAPSNFLGQAGSALGGIASIAGIFSDRRLKQDIKSLGGGLYEYAYTWDPTTRHVGVMADEVPARFRIRGMSGFDMVDYGLMALEAA